MPADETAGVAAVAKLLARVAERPGRTVAALAAELGVRRSTAFAVAASLDASGLLERDASGGLHPGPAAARLLLARYGFGAMAPIVETLLPVLRDDTDASVSLIVYKKERDFLAAHRRASWDRGSDGVSRRIEAAVGRSASGCVARLSLALRPNASEAEARSAAACAARVAAALAMALETSAHT
ncbi:MAG: MarR family transcriptional regulator [Hyphomicrobiales bacterium]|nr:MarR family transcriptional regulator [Hyphomicrobiales bacterium]MBV9905992.1 MarR family transcriptional regulator [Hyphomicrobiales bacterium]